MVLSDGTLWMRSEERWNNHQWRRFNWHENENHFIWGKAVFFVPVSHRMYPLFFAPLAKKTELESFIIYLTDVYVRRHQQFQHWQQVTICMTKKPSRFSSGIFHLPPLLVVDSFFCSSSGPCQLKWQPIHENTEHGENIHIVHTLPMSLINDESI